MIFRAFEELTFALPAVFSCRLSQADATKLLAQESERAATQEEHILGRVGDSNIVFQRYRRFMHNPFAPIFVGRLCSARNGSQLVGEFRRRKIVLLLSGLSYFILLPGIPFALVVIPLTAIWLGASLLAASLIGTLFALLLVGVLFAEAALIRLGIYAAKLDMKQISEHIDTVFNGGVV